MRARVVIAAALLLLAFFAAPFVRLNAANVRLLRGTADLASLDATYRDLTRHGCTAVSAHVGRARVALIRGDVALEISELRAAAERAHFNRVPTILLGRALEQAGQHEAAVRAYAGAPLSEEFFLERGRRAVAQSGWRAAEAPVRMAVEIRPSSADAQRAWADIQVNVLGDLDGAIVSLQKAEKIGVADGYLPIEIAHVQQMARHDDDALRTLDGFHGEHPMAHAIRGAIYLKRGRTAEALSELHRAVEVDPDNVWALFDYGNALCASGRAAEARQWWARALQKDPKFVPAIAARCDA